MPDDQPSRLRRAWGWFVEFLALALCVCLSGGPAYWKAHNALARHCRLRECFCESCGGTTYSHPRRCPDRHGHRGWYGIMEGSRDA